MTATIKGPVTAAIQQIWSSFFQAAQDYNGRKRSLKCKPDPEVQIRRLSEAQIDRHLHPKKKLSSMKYQRIITNSEDSDDLPDFSNEDDSESEKENDQKLPCSKTSIANSPENVACNSHTAKLNEIKINVENSVSPSTNERKNFLTVIEEKKKKFLYNKSINSLHDNSETPSLKNNSCNNTCGEPAAKKFKDDNTNSQQSPKSLIKEHKNDSDVHDASLSIFKPTNAIVSDPKKLSKLIKTTSLVDKGTLTVVNAKTAVNVGVNTDKIENSVLLKCTHELDGSSLLLHMKLNDVLFSNENLISKSALTLKTDKEAQDVVTHIKSVIERLDLHKKDASEEFNAMKEKYDTKMKDIEGCLEQLYSLKIELLKGMGSWIVDPVGTLKDVQQKVTDFFAPAFQNIQQQSTNASESENINVKHKIMEDTVNSSPGQTILSALLVSKSTAPSPNNQNMGIPSKSMEIKKSIIGRPAKDVDTHKNISTTKIWNLAPSQTSNFPNEGTVSIYPVVNMTSVPQNTAKHLESSYLNVATDVNRPAINVIKSTPTTVMSNTNLSQSNVLKSHSSISISPSKRMTFISQNTSSKNAAKRLEGSNLNITTDVNRPAMTVIKSTPTTVTSYTNHPQANVLQSRSSISISSSNRTTSVPQNTTQTSAKPLGKFNNSMSGRNAVAAGLSNMQQAPPPYHVGISQANFPNNHLPWKSQTIPVSTSNSSTNFNQGQLFYNSGAMLTSNSQPPSQKQRQPLSFPQTGPIPQNVALSSQPRISVQPLEKLQAKSHTHPQYSTSASSLQTSQSNFQGLHSQATTRIAPSVTAPSSHLATQHVQLQQATVQPTTTTATRYMMHMQQNNSPNVIYPPNIPHGLPTRMTAPHFTQHHYPASTAPVTLLKVGNYPVGGNVQSSSSASSIHQHSFQTAIAPITNSSDNNQKFTSATSEDDIQEITTCFLCGKDSSIACCGPFVYCSQECKDDDFERHQTECTASRL